MWQTHSASLGFCKHEAAFVSFTFLFEKASHHVKRIQCRAHLASLHFCAQEITYTWWAFERLLEGKHDVTTACDATRAYSSSPGNMVWGWIPTHLCCVQGSLVLLPQCQATFLLICCGHNNPGLVTVLIFEPIYPDALPRSQMSCHELKLPCPPTLFSQMESLLCVLVITSLWLWQPWPVLCSPVCFHPAMLCKLVLGITCSAPAGIRGLQDHPVVVVG